MAKAKSLLGVLTRLQLLLICTGFTWCFSGRIVCLNRTVVRLMVINAHDTRMCRTVHPSLVDLKVKLRNHATGLGEKVRSNPMQYLSIPFVAAFVGYITNYLGVWMLFYPLEWKGIPIVRYANQPFGFLGWQGVVPAKRLQMATTMVDVTISRLLKVSEVFARLNAQTISDILTPCIQRGIFGGMMPTAIVNLILQRVAADVILNVEKLVSIKDLVVKGMTTDAGVLGSFFQRVGSKELSFLVTSGSYVGFALGIVQMLQLMIYPANWTLPVSGALVGYITNWIALKWIFEPLNPTKVGPFILQGLFLRRQREVSAEFSAYISANILTSQEVWKAILSGANEGKLAEILYRNVPFLNAGAVGNIISILRQNILSIPAAVATTTGALLHQYTNDKLGLKKLLIERMSRLSPAEFEQVLHPIFQEDEIILIAAGGVLGGLAGGLQWWVNVALEKRRQAKERATATATANSTNGSSEPVVTCS